MKKFNLNTFVIGLSVVAITVSIVAIFSVNKPAFIDKNEFCSQQVGEAVVELSLFRDELKSITLSTNNDSLRKRIALSSSISFTDVIGESPVVYAGQPLITKTRVGIVYVECDDFYLRIARDELAYLSGLVDSAVILADNNPDAAKKLLESSITHEFSFYPTVRSVIYTVIASEYFDYENVKNASQFYALSEDSKELISTLVEKRKEFEEKYP